MPVKIPYYVFSHHRKIANLYKKWIRRLEDHYHKRADFRYKAALARAEFDVIFNEKDLRKSKEMLLKKEEELHKKFFIPPIIFPTSPGGVDDGRHHVYEDWVLDLWHPLEKAMYPQYFAKRELRKQQYIEMWNKLHGPPKPDGY